MKYEGEWLLWGDEAIRTLVVWERLSFPAGKSFEELAPKNG